MVDFLVNPPYHSVEGRAGQQLRKKGGQLKKALDMVFKGTQILAPTLAVAQTWW
jgi:hypothetical protein